MRIVPRLARRRARAEDDAMEFAIPACARATATNPALHALYVKPHFHAVKCKVEIMQWLTENVTFLVGFNVLLETSLPSQYNNELDGIFRQPLGRLGPLNEDSYLKAFLWLLNVGKEDYKSTFLPDPADDCGPRIEKHLLHQRIERIYSDCINVPENYAPENGSI